MRADKRSLGASSILRISREGTMADWIREKTVLILGAGASYPYGFPLGKQLYDDVIRNAQHKNHQILQRVLGTSGGAILEFINALSYSGYESVDAFLEKREDFISRGKSAIALEIMGHEQLNIQEIFSTENTADTNSAPRGKWYKLLRLAINLDPEWIDQNEISILTYNYDRSLEHFLFNAIMHSYNKSEDEARSLLSYIPIMHLHGALGSLPWEKKEKPRDYGCKITEDIVRRHLNSIRIMNERIEESEDFLNALSIIENADRVLFLGFGFGDTNLKRILSSINKPKYVAGTAIGLSRYERKMIENLLRDRSIRNKAYLQDGHLTRSHEQIENAAGIDLAPSDMNIYEFLKDYVPLR